MLALPRPLRAALLACCAGLSLAAADNPATVPAAPAPVPDWLAGRYAAIARELGGGIDLAAVDVLFVGDSITQFWLNNPDQWRPSFASPGAPYHGLDLGVAGDRTENVLQRLRPRADGGMGNLDDPRLRPRVIVLMIGTNNVFKTYDAEQIRAGCLAVATDLLRREPQAHLVLCPILPLSDARLTREKVAPVDTALAHADFGALGAGRTTWLDLYPRMVDAQGAQLAELFRDGVHLNAKGYAVWLAELLPVLRRSLPGK